MSRLSETKSSSASLTFPWSPNNQTDSPTQSCSFKQLLTETKNGSSDCSLDFNSRNKLNKPAGLNFAHNSIFLRSAAFEFIWWQETELRYSCKNSSFLVNSRTSAGWIKSARFKRSRQVFLVDTICKLSRFSRTMFESKL